MKWYKNKWGWIGGGAGLLSVLILIGPQAILLVSDKWYIWAIYLLPKIIPKGILKILWISIPLQIIYGFVVGLILEKLWRKWK